jgi:hypothetical protein
MLSGRTLQTDERGITQGPGNREHDEDSASGSGTTQEAPLAGAAGIPTSDTPDRNGILLTIMSGRRFPCPTPVATIARGEDRWVSPLHRF